MSSCSNLKKVALFDEPQERIQPPNIDGFYALDILEDKLSSEVWFTNNLKCLRIDNELQTKYSGEGSIHLTWDKQAGGCPWMGMGIGWDGWTPKDLSRILDKAAIRIKVFSKDKIVKSLPLAACLEDYSGLQAWIGFHSNFINVYDNDSGWSTVILPLSQFDWEMNEADPGNIKQMIIQFEASGDVYFDEIKIIPFKGNIKQKVICKKYSQPIISIDGYGKEQEWIAADTIKLGNHILKMISDDKNLYLYGVIEDSDPLINKNKGDDIWNGDAIEIAFATSAEANLKRKMYLLSDQHIGVSATQKPQIWNWRTHSEVKGAEAKTQLKTNGYSIEIKIPLQELEATGFEIKKYYGLEIAVDDGGENGARKIQSRWNSVGTEGFHNNPSLWGQVIFEE